MHYREAGPVDAPVLLLLHGFPTSSHMFRSLIPLLADDFRVIAPDHIGFGRSSAPPATDFTYTFAELAAITGEFTERLGLTSFALYVQDYGAPIGLRLALTHPERVTAIVTQNGNAYEEGLGKHAWAPVREIYTLDGIKWQYLHGVPEDQRELVSPDTTSTTRHCRPGPDRRRSSST